MNTLRGDDIFTYLSNLKRDLQAISQSKIEGSLLREMHAYMLEVMEAEILFLRRYSSTGVPAQLSISPNGLPSVDSLGPDLTAMYKSKDENPLYEKIGENFDRGIQGKDTEDQAYINTTVEGWQAKIDQHTNDASQNLIAEKGFAINQHTDGRFQFCFRENIFLDGLDKYCKEYPIAIRTGTIFYNAVWNILLEEGEEHYFIVDTESVIKGDVDKPRVKIFDNIDILYRFTRRDFPTVCQPWFFRKYSEKSFDYAAFLESGTEKRLKVTKQIIGILEEGLGHRVVVKGMNDAALAEALRFSNIPFKNAPKEIPKEKDLFERCEKRTPKYKTLYSIIPIFGQHDIGTIEYILPYKSSPTRNGNPSKFRRGGIKLQILGEAVETQEQFDMIGNALHKI